MSRRTYQWNAFESQLAAAITPGATSIVLSSTTNLREPGRMVIAPADPAKREFVRYETITGSTLENVTRGIAGSTAGAQSHDVGVAVRMSHFHQVTDDIFGDIEDGEAWQSGHLSAPDPHPNYQTQAEGDARYVELSGDTMTGPLVLPADPTTDLQAATKQYVDAQILDSIAIPQPTSYTSLPTGGGSTILGTLDLSSKPAGSKWTLTFTIQIGWGNIAGVLASTDVLDQSGITYGAWSATLAAQSPNVYSEIRLATLSMIWTVGTGDGLNPYGSDIFDMRISTAAFSGASGGMNGRAWASAVEIA